MRNILDILENKALYLSIAKQRLLCKKILQALVNLEKGGRLNVPGKERLLKGAKLIEGFIDLCNKLPNRSLLDEASAIEYQISLEELKERIKIIINGGNAEVGLLKDFFGSLEKYNSVFHVPKGLISL